MLSLLCFILIENMYIWYTRRCSENWLHKSIIFHFFLFFSNFFCASEWSILSVWTHAHMWNSILMLLNRLYAFQLKSNQKKKRNPFVATPRNKKKNRKQRSNELKEKNRFSMVFFSLYLLACGLGINSDANEKKKQRIEK